MPRWTRKNSAVRRLGILEAAKRLFIEYGSERYSLAAIAEQADLLEKDRRGYVGLLGRVLQEAQDDGEVDSALLVFRRQRSPRRSSLRRTAWGATTRDSFQNASSRKGFEP